MIINGKEKDMPSGINVTQLLEKLELEHKKVVVEVNAEIIGATLFDTHILNAADKIEIIAFVGGG